MHDWLKEHHQNFPTAKQKTIFNFVKWVKHKYNLPYEPPIWNYMVVQETPYGLQGQVDFGEYNMRSSDGRRMKVYFFTIVLSRSRFKYVCFSSKPFTSYSAILAHEDAFKYMGGVTSEVVYDQDKVFISIEISGELILTSQLKPRWRTGLSNKMTLDLTDINGHLNIDRETANDVRIVYFAWRIQRVLQNR